MPSINSFNVTLGDLNYLLDQMRAAIVVLHVNNAGQSVYGYVDSTGVSRELGLFGTFDPLSVTDFVTGLPIYDGAREASGFRVTAGLFNNLVDLTRWSWGAVNDPFPRLTQADFVNYVQQVATNPALAGYTVPAGALLASAAAYGNLNQTVVDYTPRMITQTITSSYGQNAPAQAIGTTLAAGSAASTAMAPGEVLIFNVVGGNVVVFQFFSGTPNPSAGNLVGIDVSAGVTVAAALAAMQAGLRGLGGGAALDATVSVNPDGNIAVALGSVGAGELVIYDYAGLGLGGVFDPSAASDSALIRTGAWTDILTSDNVITAVDANGVVATASVTEYISRNLNTLPGDPSTSGIFTLFGQFFDHGLDFIDKGGQGSKIIIPLSPTDPLYRAPIPATGDRGNTTITISRATPDNYTITDLHGRQVSIAGANGVWGDADDVKATGADGVYGTADDIHGAMIKPTVTSYTDHTSPYIDQGQTYGSGVQMTAMLREWVIDPNTGQYRPGAELYDGHVTQAYNSQVFDDASASGLGAGVTTRTVPTLNEMREHIRETGRDDLTWDDINNFRARDAQGHVITGTSGYVYTGQAVLLDMNPRFDFSHLHPDDNNAATAWDSVEAAKVASAIATLNSSLTGGDTLGWVAGQLTLHLASAHGAVPAGSYTGASAMMLWVNFANFSILPSADNVYDAVGELLMAAVGDHYIAGDGRANENFGLTAMHHVFHENHNVQLINLENIILGQADPVVRHNFQAAVNFTVAPTGTALHVGNHYEDANHNYTTSNGTVSWDQDKMFDATKLINEMEYQHVAIDQYARLVTPDLPEFVTYDNDINADISLEYSQAAFRFGHSQLRDTIDTIDPSGLVTKWALSAAFLNPAAYAASGAEDILRGMSHQLTNEVDEFLTPALQQSLLGQPLDLGAINIARGRDLGLPTLNETRRQLHDALVAERNADPTTPHHSNLIVDALNPYTSWAEFGSQMQHPESLVDFIAAYSFDGDLAKAHAIVGLEDGSIATGSPEAQGYTIQQAIAFLNGGDVGYNKIDLWVGGLAELHVFTGQLGTTFNAIFEDQMERLMDGDRFYYLYRLGLALPIDPDLGHVIVTEQFKDIIERTTGALHLNGDVMGYADSNVDLAKMYAAAIATQHLGIFSGFGGGIAGDGTVIQKSNTDLGFTNQQYISDFRPDIGENPDGTAAAGYNSHEVISGTDFNDWLDAGNGDDTIYGDKGNDVLDGKAGADHIYGGDGQDVIYGGDIEDFLDGGKGDDIVYAGTSAGALDVVIGGDGNDKLYGEAGIDEIYGGAGDDYIDAGGDTDLAFGDGGNDVMYGGDGPDELRGGDGDDILSGGSGGDKLLGERGDDIIMGGIGQAAQVGDSDEVLGDVGFDLASYTDVSIKLDVAADLRNQNLTAAAGGTAFNPFNQLLADMEGLVGTKFDDKFGATLANPAGTAGIIGDDNDNWLIGGGGSDTFNTRIANTDGIIGSGGNDVIIGDSIRLDKLIGKYASYVDGMDANGNATHAALGSLGDGLLGNAVIGTEMFAKHFTDLQRTEANRDFVLGGDSGAAGAADTAIFTGNKADYTIDVISFFSPNEGTTTAYKIRDNGHISNGPNDPDRAPTDGTDLMVGIEKLQFADGTIDVNQLVNIPATGTPLVSDMTPTEGQVLSLDLSAIQDANGLPVQSSVHYQWQQSIDGSTWTNIAGATNATFAPQDLVNGLGFSGADAQSGMQLRAVVSFTDGGGHLESLTSAATGPVGIHALNWSVLNGNFNGNAGDDIALGVSGLLGNLSNDVFSGNGGNDTLSTFGGNDTITGGAGNDVIDGGSGSDTAVYAGSIANFGLSATTIAITVADHTGAEGTDTLTSVEQLRFNGVNYGVVMGSIGNNANLNGASGANNSQAVFGLAGDDTINGGAGNDYIDGGAGSDVITQAAASGGHDFIDGGANPATGDRFVLNGDGTDEVFRVYARADAIAAGITGLNADTEIVITRNGTNAASVVAELHNIEEVTINTGAGTDTVVPIGDFTPTSLNYSTITINGSAGDDTVDISSLQSAHRIVFHSNGGHDTIIGTLRDQDVIDLADGTVLADYVVTTEGPMTTLSHGSHSISYLSEGTPQFVEHQTPPATDGEDDDNGHGEDGGGADCDPSDDDAGTGSSVGHTIVGTAAGDVLIGTSGGDLVFGLGGVDNIVTGAGADVIRTDAGGDFIDAGAGRDVVFAGGGNDDVFGGADADMLYGEDGDDRLFGDDGSDLLDAGDGNDTVFGGLGDDLFVGHIGDGSDTYDGGAGNDTLDMGALTGPVVVDLGTGIGGRGSVVGVQSGTDTLYGFENVTTGSGNDRITASTAVNMIDGGDGNDVFIFGSAAAADGDTILQFETGDVIDLTGIDADVGMAGVQSFSLVSGGASPAPGQLVVTHETHDGENVTVISGNTGNADGHFRFDVSGSHNLTNTDFQL